MQSSQPPAARPPDDLVDFFTAARFFQPTGHPVSHSTLRREAEAAGVKIWKQGRRHFVSLSDVLVLHGERQEENAEADG
ncbi:hypothetical protein PV516_19435 [Streptomyces scabiei]|uniref:hypothetical protein n=1 Tax=Streptomyces scabiei TaxID=1930 RepID=UPI0029A1A0E7|nr:hypothetical protein [Streptomyces scabiei]MDX3165963.1 hypothetical protein [Streptomyces scabiei]